MKSALLSEKATPAVAFCFFMNALLEREPWARERLAAFAGETVELVPVPLPPLRVTILEDGRLQAGGEAPDLVLQVGPDAVFALARGEEEFLRAVEVNGNARLAQEVASLARHLRWDIEEELARVFGDVAAHRMAGAARGFAAWHLDVAKRVTTAAADFLAEEARILVRRDDQAVHARAVAELRDALARLEKRIERLG
ncbi:MAG: ubiquinone biosynthesis accessory factor UbiJ [Betaproteobacteria bacterium]|nr:ubiquinone biosynthesis accessory factor UbiJ [Betaproteobacteria bacterium]